MYQPSENSSSFDHLTEEVADSAEKSQRGNFYSVFIPHDVREKATQPSNYIYKDKTEAMKMVKKTKKARFKHFEFFHEALKFASVGMVDLPGPPSINGSVKNSNFIPQVGEKMSPFKGPKPQDLVKLRKAIETGDIEGFKQAIWENPRYLVSSGDTPSILQEGFRYNALHIAAKAKNGVLAELILNTISNPKFVKLLYGDDGNENIETRIQVLLDLYLNTPDKGLNETPLHFASKFGAADVVEVLVSFPECDKNLKNKYGQTPDMIICDRCDNKEHLNTLKKRIALHLENSYYVPVLRAEDDSMAPLVGEPFSPGKSAVINNDPLSPRLEIHAFAGPMNKEGAEQFRKVWKTPPRTSTPKRKRNDESFDSVISLRYTDHSKGLERLGQKLASKFDVEWKEYWPFLDCFIDIASDEGLDLLENYLAAKLDEVNVDSSPVMPVRSLSTIADLCLQMQNCHLDCSSEFSSFLNVEKACNVFANRIAGEICQRNLNDFFAQVVSSLEMQVRKVQLLVLSYLDDCRFNNVNFSQLHPRLGLLTSQKLCNFINKSSRLEYIQSINKFVMECVKAFDCFSSDDEGNYSKDNKHSSAKKHLICLMQNILNNFTQDTEPEKELDNENSCREAWTKTKECTCVYHMKKSRKSLGLSRNNSSRHSRLKTSRQLFRNEKIDVETSSSDEDFFTPPESPSQIHDSDNEADFSDVPLAAEVFIEGSKPTKTDNALFRALKYSDCCLLPEKYPNIYKWYHTVGLYKEAERESWPRPKNQVTPSSSFATPPRQAPKISFQSPSSNSWLRITGVNSPRASLQKLNV